MTHITHHYHFHAEVIIGFINQPYNVSEDDGKASVEIGVISGIPGRNITVQLAFFDRSAVCKFMAIQFLWRTILRKIVSCM